MVWQMGKSAVNEQWMKEVCEYGNRVRNLGSKKQQENKRIEEKAIGGSGEDTL